MNQIKNCIEKLLAYIVQAEKKHQRKTDSVKLVIVSKAQSVESIRSVIECGQLQFGESYLQEALTKINTIANPKVIWHYIGRIQTSKIKAIANNFSWVQSVASEKHAKLLAQSRSPLLSPLNVCIQVNICNEKSKGGVSPDKILSLAQVISSQPQLKLRGIMAIPPICNNFDSQVKIFELVKNEFDKLIAEGFKLDTLSMGMSNDYEAAIAAGATMIRIGSAIFGPRESTFE